MQQTLTAFILSFLIFPSLISQDTTAYSVLRDCSTIQEVMDRTSDGDAIFVSPGTYNETIIWPVEKELLDRRSQVINEHAYIDKVKPSTTPLLFAKDFISNDSIAEFGSIFNKENDAFYFAIDANDRSSIKFTQYQGGSWVEPVDLLSDSVYSFNDPFLSNDESRLYYISDLPRNKLDTIKDFDIWYSNREGENWSAPINAGLAINSDAQEYYISFAESGSIYFASNKGKNVKRQHDFDIYKSEFVNGVFETPQRLCDSVNTKSYEADVFISPDESYIIYCTARKTGLGRGDLNISFKDGEGNWTQSINMGDQINSENHELCPFVTKDGKYFFYTSNQDIYWVSTEFIDEIREGSR